MPNTTYGSPYAQSSDLVSNWPGVSLNVADRLDDVSFKGNGLNDQTGTTYTMVLTDAGKTVTLNNASAVTVTIPTNASVAFETGTRIEFTNKGAGDVTISPAGGVTLNNSSTIPQNQTASIRKLDTNTWVMIAAPAAGLTLITSSTFSAVSSVSVNSCFTSTYKNYAVLLELSADAAARSLFMRMRASGSDNSSSNYKYAGVLVQTKTSTAAVGTNGTGLTTAWAMGSLSDSEMSSHFVQIRGPQTTDHTNFQNHFFDNYKTDDGYFGSYAGAMSVNTSYDGLTVYPGAGSITGTIRVYGYRNSL